ncbi:MAG: hypothetical protein ACYTGZ_15120 [Planctomycetota bacterium]|jgi:hypothetical protein
MSELHDALAQIREIRARMATSQVYRGYRVVPTALSAVLAVATAFAQARWLGSSWLASSWLGSSDLYAYVVLWSGCGLASVLMAGIAMARHCATSPSRLTRARTAQAITRLAPALLAGALVTWILVRAAPDAAWTLPGLWQVFFALGLFASAGHLPHAILYVGGFYLLSGCFVLSLGEGAFAPWAMGLPFAIGQSACALILHFHKEECDAQG